MCLFIYLFIYLFINYSIIGNFVETCVCVGVSGVSGVEGRPCLLGKELQPEFKTGERLGK